MSTTLIHPAKGISGSLRPPGDKSISHRYAMLGAIANGATRLENFSTGADCASTLTCLEKLGVRCDRDGSIITIHGRGPPLQTSASPLDCGNSGSTMRMLSGILAGQEFTSELIGDASLSRRPMARVITPLAAMGATIHAHDGARPPLRITGARLKAIHYEMPIASAQVKTAVLFAGLLADGETSVAEPIRTRDHTEIALRAFGANPHAQGNRIRIRGREELHAIQTTIPGDLSTAAFFMCASELRLKESDRVACVAANLRAMGAEVDEREDGLRIPGGQQLHGADIDSFGDHRIAMAFAVAALRADGETRIRHAESAGISYPGFFETLESVLER